jgi:hypothetical protein
MIDPRNQYPNGAVRLFLLSLTKRISYQPFLHAGAEGQSHNILRPALVVAARSRLCGWW